MEIRGIIIIIIIITLQRTIQNTRTVRCVIAIINKGPSSSQVAQILIGVYWYNTVIPDVRGEDSAHPRVSVSVDLPLVRSFYNTSTEYWILSVRLSCQVNVKGPFLELRTDKPSREILSRSNYSEYSVEDGVQVFLYVWSSSTDTVNADKNTGSSVNTDYERHYQTYRVHTTMYGIQVVFRTTDPTKWMSNSWCVLNQTQFGHRPLIWLYTCPVQGKSTIIIIRRTRNKRLAPSK